MGTCIGVPSRVGCYSCPGDDDDDSDTPSRLGLISEVKGAIDLGRGIIGGLDKGSKGPYPLVGQGNATDQARAARAESYLIGAVLGSVLSARLALGARQKVGASTEKALYDHKIEQMQALAPATLSAARNLGTADDAGDGRQGLAELVRLGQGFSAPWAGHAGADHSVLDQSTIDLANQLHQLDVSKGTNTLTVEDLAGGRGAVAGTPGATPGAPGMPGGPAQAGLAGGGGLTTYLVLGAGLYALSKIL